MKNNNITPNEQLMFDKVRELCQLNGRAIYEISRSCNIPCTLVAKFYMNLMAQLVDETEKDIKNDK